MTASSVREAPEGAAPKAPGGSVPRRAQGRPRGRSQASSTSLTGRGGIVVVLLVGLLGALLSRWTGVGLLAGTCFVAGCVLAALATRPADLLTFVVSPPLTFLVITLIAEFVAALGDGSLLRGMAVGVLTTLSTTAPWLFLGTLLAVGLTIPRGLMTNVRELRDRMAGSRLFEEDQNQDPVRWEEPPAEARRSTLPHGDID